MLSSLPVPRSSSFGLFGLVLALLLWTGCNQNGQNSGSALTVGEPVTDSTVAVIVSSEYGTDSLSVPRFQQQLGFIQQRTPPSERSTTNFHRRLVTQVAQSHVLRGMAEEEADAASVDSTTIAQRITQIRQRFQQQRPDSTLTLEAFMQMRGMTMDSLRQSIAQQMATQQTMREIQQNIIGDIPSPSSADVDAYSKREENLRIGAQHILLNVEQDAPQPTVDSVRSKAQALIDSATTSGADFNALARRHSEGPSAGRGGDLGLFGKGQMVPAFSEAAFSLSDSGDVYQEPVRTRFGFHIIRLTNPGEPMDTTQARQQLTQERQRTALEDELLSQATVRINPEVVDADL